jgi:hypothetical protein
LFGAQSTRELICRNVVETGGIVAIVQRLPTTDFDLELFLRDRDVLGRNLVLLLPMHELLLKAAHQDSLVNLLRVNFTLFQEYSCLLLEKGLAFDFRLENADVAFSTRIACVGLVAIK